MKIWVDDIRKPSKGYIWVKSCNQCIHLILTYYANYLATKDDRFIIEKIDLDHDAGDMYGDGGDFKSILEFFEIYQDTFPYIPAFHIHSMNPVGAENMRRIIKHNGWVEI